MNLELFFLTLYVPVAVLSCTQDIVGLHGGDSSTFLHTFSLNMFLPGMKTYSYSLESHHYVGEMT